MHFNLLNPAELERLALLSEELGEVQQVIGKILRHGYESRNPVDENSKKNRDLLTAELGDLQFAISLLQTAGDINEDAMRYFRQRKEQRVWVWLHHNTNPKEAK